MSLRSTVWGEALRPRVRADAGINQAECVRWRHIVFQPGVPATMKDLIKLGITLPRWRSDAACAKLEPGEADVIFFDDDKANEVSPAASKFCNGCEIQGDCLDWAMRLDEVGVWGNTTHNQRKKLKRIITRVYCPGCGGVDILEQSDGCTEVCLSCALSWRI